MRERKGGRGADVERNNKVKCSTYRHTQVGKNNEGNVKCHCYLLTAVE